MKDIIKEMQEPALFKYGFYRDNKLRKYNKEGISYSLSSKLGKGSYWVYAQENLFSITIQNYVFYKDFFYEFQHPAYIGINYYDSVSGNEFTPYKRLKCNCIRGHISNNELFQAVYHKNIPIRSIGIEFMPEYYEDYLNTKYPGEFKNPHSAFMSIDGSTNFPELVFILRQIRNFRGTGIAAKMYYEGKVSETVSLIIEKTKQQKTITKRNLSNLDLERIETVKAYIDDHFAFDIHQKQLAKIAYMGISKLKYSFKETYKCNITEYIQNKRITHAEHLLCNTNFTIKEIAEIVGYHHTGHFSKLFQRNIGLLPNEYRKMIAKK